MSPSKSRPQPARGDGRSHKAPDYDLSVFINCPFDDEYQPLFRAAVFTVFDCGFVPRCALEVYNSGQVRIEKIFKIIEGCRFGIHDISRTELDPANRLPRFNMPLELGMFLGAQRFGAGRHKHKNCLVLDLEPHRYQKFISDIAGQDIAAHSGDAATFVQRIRDWLRAASGRTTMPGGAAIFARFEAFQAALPDLCAAIPLKVSELTFSDYANLASEWLRLREYLDMTSATYKLFRQAILTEKQVTCVFDGHPRELCPVIIGHTKGVEKVLAFQIGGTSRSGLPPGGEWRCLRLSGARDAKLRDGPWREGARHTMPQTCVEEVDIDVNIHVRKRR